MFCWQLVHALHSRTAVQLHFKCRWYEITQINSSSWPDHQVRCKFPHAAPLFHDFSEKIIQAGNFSKRLSRQVCIYSERVKIPQPLHKAPQVQQELCTKQSIKRKAEIQQTAQQSSQYLILQWQEMILHLEKAKSVICLIFHACNTQQVQKRNFPSPHQFSVPQCWQKVDRPSPSPHERGTFTSQRAVSALSEHIFKPCGVLSAVTGHSLHRA